MGRERERDRERHEEGEREREREREREMRRDGEGVEECGAGNICLSILYAASTEDCCHASQSGSHQRWLTPEKTRERERERGGGKEN